MSKQPSYTLKDVKSLGKNKSDANLSLLIDLYKREDLDVDIKREVVSSIGRQTNLDAVYRFIDEYAFKKSTIMEYVYQMFRTCLYKQSTDSRFAELKQRILDYYQNEILYKMNEYYEYKHTGGKRKVNKINTPILLVGDCEDTLLKLSENSVQLAFTSPPYYNARAYSDYHSYKDYLEKMKRVFVQCHRVIEDGRFLIVNVSPVITKRPGREFESIRYPIHFDFHKILEEAGFYFIDEIIWIKPEPCVKNRVGGYQQTRKALSYKPNCITESVLVYRKKCPFLLDKNIDEYDNYDKYPDEKIDTTNCWYITPKSDKEHPAVFPEELCRRILKYYSFEGDAVLDPFAGSGTFGKVAHKMKRIPIMCETDEHYIKLITEDKIKYDVRK
ncbi:MAG: site-specific DNA-methyltransferase [Corallococcus sp.]|nr:site-specific DNA-methyltransferase [Bacillota bacterium]MCM1534194.1 site-specific DNA-methyltransferase [Corallococcus sp.]